MLVEVSRTGSQGYRVRTLRETRTWFDAGNLEVTSEDRARFEHVRRPPGRRGTDPSFMLTVEPSVSPAEGLLSRLRAATRTRHERLDLELGLAGVTSDARRYADFLRASLSAVERLEPAVEALLGSRATVSRCACLRADLDALGGGAVRAIAFRAPADVAEAYGAGYVMAGSALGGMVLASRLCPPLRARAAAYLTLGASPEAEPWRAFLGRLAAYDREATDVERERACVAACDAFDLYHEAFAAHGLCGERCSP